jgi:hypothetical protein
MEIDKTKVVTQDELEEPSPMEQVEDRVEAEMKIIEAQAKEQVAHGLQDKDLEREAQRLKEEGERALKLVEKADGEKKNS